MTSSKGIHIMCFTNSIRNTTVDGMEILSYPAELIVSATVTASAMPKESSTLVRILELTKKDNPKCRIRKVAIKNATEPMYVFGDFVPEKRFVQWPDL